MNTEKMEEFEVLIPTQDETGVAERVKVSVPLKWDEELKEWLLTAEAHGIIETTKARRMGLLLPEEFKALREKYCYSQKEMGELFQVGEKSWTRWESGKHRPSRSINLLIKALYENEISINYLLRRAGKPEKKDSDWSSNISYEQTWAYNLHSLSIQAGYEQAAIGDNDLPVSSRILKTNSPTSKLSTKSEDLFWLENLNSGYVSIKCITDSEISVPRLKFSRAA